MILIILELHRHFWEFLNLAWLPLDLQVPGQLWHQGYYLVVTCLAFTQRICNQIVLALKNMQKLSSSQHVGWIAHILRLVHSRLVVVQIHHICFTLVVCYRLAHLFFPSGCCMHASWQMAQNALWHDVTLHSSSCDTELTNSQHITFQQIGTVHCNFELEL